MLRKETSLDPGEHCSAGPGDVGMVVPASTAQRLCENSSPSPFTDDDRGYREPVSDG